MEGLKNMGLKRCFFLLSVFCLATALLLTLGVYLLCGRIAERYPQGGIAIDSGGTVTELAGPDREQMQILELLDGVRLLSAVLFPAGGLGFAGILFYRLKLKAPIEILKMGTGRIRSHDLDFSMPEASADELGQICAAFEMMRKELLETNRKLWQQAEERKRLNAAFAHDLRNPVTVLKGSVKLMKGGGADEHTLDRMERYVLRVEQYVEAMSGIQRLEQIQVRLCDTDGSALLEELEETAHLLAPELDLILSVPDLGIVRIDHGIFLTVAENLIGNAARFACRKLEIRLTRTGHMLCLMVADDGPGFPPELVKNGPKPFGKMEENAEHFGMRTAPDEYLFSLWALFAENPEIREATGKSYDKTYEDATERMLGALDLSVFRPGVDVRMLLEEIDSCLMRCVWQMLSAGKLDPDGLEKDFLKRVGQWRTAYLK